MTEGTAGDVMTSEYFRAHMPDDIRRDYEAGLALAQQLLEPLSREISHTPWLGPTASP
jgi:hypothetical protein